MKMTTGRLSARSRIAKNISRVCAALAAMGLAGVCLPAQADVFNVGGAGVIGTTTITNTAGGALVPNSGGNWAMPGGESYGYGALYSRLTSSTMTVSNSGTVTLKFTHRYNFEQAWDGGAVYVSVNGGAFTYVPTNAFTANGYICDTTTNFNGWTENSSAFPDGSWVFTGQSTDWGTPAYIESVATLGSYSAGVTIAVQFCGGNDDWTGAPAPNWEITNVQVSDALVNDMLNVTFTNGPSSFTVESDTPHFDWSWSPWAYAGTITNQFELDCDTTNADKFAAYPAGSVIDLNGAKLKVVQLSGLIKAGQSFSLFDLSGGSTLTGAYSSIEFPPVTWDLSGLQPGGNGQITALSSQNYIYTWTNTTSGTFDWETANWDYTPTNPAPSTIWPDGQGAVANLSALADSSTLTVTNPTITIGELDWCNNSCGVSVNGETLVFDNGPLPAKLSKNSYTTTCGSELNFSNIVLNSTLDIDERSHVTSQISINGTISGPGGLNIVQSWGDGTWPGIALYGQHTYLGGTTVGNGTVPSSTMLTLAPSGGTPPSITNGVVLNNGSIKIAGLSTMTSLQNIVGGTITGTGDILTEGNILFDNDSSSWHGGVLFFGNFPGVIQFTSIKNVGGGPSALGDPQDAAQGIIGLYGVGVGGIEYIGAGDQTDRIIAFSVAGDLEWSATVKASGTTTVESPFKITSDLAGNGGSYFMLGGTGAGEWAGKLSDRPGRALRIRKVDSGTWTFSGTNTYTDATEVNEGTLRTTHASVFPTNATVKLAGGTLDLAFTGMNMVSELHIDGVKLADGVYGSNNVAAITGGGFLVVGIPLVANFTATPQTGVAPLEVVLADTSVSLLGAITNWSWNFGNGVTTNYTNFVAALTNVYASWGTYPVQLTVLDDAGYSNSATINVTATQPLSIVVESNGQYAAATVNIGPNVVVFSNGVVNPAFGGLTGSGSLVLTNASADCVTLVVGGDGPDTKFEGDLTGCGGLTKVGANKFSLSGTNNTYTGDTIVSNGTLKLSGAASLPVTSGLQLWLDASDAATLFTDVGGTVPVSNSGDTVQLWKDKSGNTGRDVSNGSSPPTYQTGQIGGLSVVHFNGGQSIENSYNPGTPYSIFSVSRLTGGQDGRLITAVNNNWLLGYHGGQINRFFFEGWVNESGSTADTSTHFFSATGSGSLSTVYDLIGGTTPLASNGNGTQAPNGLNLGGSTYGEYSKGDVGEVLIYNRVVDSSGIASINDYFTAKWISGGGGGAGNILPTNTILRLVSPGVLNLAGGTNTVAALYLNGAHQVAGTWGATGSGADHVNDDFFSGTGLLVVMTLPAPTGLTAQALNERVNLTWSAVSEATGYLLSRASTSNGAPDATFPTAALTYLNTGLINGTEYWYAVAATNNSGPGANSEWVAATPQAPTPPSFLPGSGITHVDPITGHATIAFGVTSNWYYRIVYKDDLLTGDWLPVQPPTNGWHTATNSGIMTLIDTNTAGGVTQRFYRIEMQ